MRLTRELALAPVPITASKLPAVYPRESGGGSEQHSTVNDPQDSHSDRSARAAYRAGRLGAPHLRRRAERNGIDIRHILEQLVEGREMLDAIDGSVATGNGSEFDARRLSNRGNVLVSGNLSETDDGNADSSHGSLSRPLRIDATGFTSMAWAL